MCLKVSYHDPFFLSLNYFSGIILAHRNVICLTNFLKLSNNWLRRLDGVYRPYPRGGGGGGNSQWRPGIHVPPLVIYKIKKILPWL